MMPRKGRGGARTGSAGAAYSNRSDLQQAVRTAPSAQYGQGAKLQAAQKAIPLPDNTQLPAPQAAPSPTPMPGGQGQPVPLPGQAGALDRETDRPGEHVMSGLPTGGGAGPSLGAFNGPDADVGMQLRALYSKFPNQDLADLINVFDASRGGQ